MSELLRSVMVECAELARAGRTPAPFYGCAQVMGGGGALGIVQPPIAVVDAPTVPVFKGPVIVYNRDTDLRPTTERRRRSRQVQHPARAVQPVRRVA